MGLIHIMPILGLALIITCFIRRRARSDSFRFSSRREMKLEEDCMASEGKKCEHPVCSCITTKKYCSEACEAMEKRSDIDCRCNHPACKGKVR
jgi:hypothetical protein